MSVPLSFIPAPAEGDDRHCSCIICHLPRRESDGVERGAPVEWMVRMRLRDSTIWQGLHTECWNRNREGEPESGTARLEQLIERLGPEPELGTVELPEDFFGPKDEGALCVYCGRTYPEHDSVAPCGETYFTEESERVTHLVVIAREGVPEVTEFRNMTDAEAFFESASANWTESYLCEVVRGPRARGGP